MDDDALEHAAWVWDQEDHAARGDAPAGLVYLPHPDLAGHLDLEAQRPADAAPARLPIAVARWVPWKTRAPENGSR